MATIAELEQEIRDIQDGISSQYVSDTQRQKLQTILDAKKSELATMQLPKAGALAPKPQAPMATPSVQGEENGLAAIAQMLNAFMSGGGMGADSFEIKQMIKQYLDTEKVNLSELDQSVIDEIKRNQRVTIELPNFGLKFEMDKSDAEIPNIFSIIDDALAGNNVFLIGEAGGGKAGSLNSKILTESGWKTYATIKLGDKVWGEDGKLYEVNGVYDRGNKAVYGVHMNDGGYTETCDEHLWKVYTRNDRHRKKVGRVLPLSEFKDKLYTNNGAANTFIDVAKAIPFKEQEHLIDPYLMGVLIGDGSLTQKSISITKDSQELFDSLVLPQGVRLSKRNNENRCLTYGISIEDGENENVLTKELERVDLFGKKSINKFIPKEYLYDSIDNRISLLQGLNDTDGTCDSTHFEFSTSSEVLANDYTELVRSLGGTAKITSRIPTYIYNGERKNGNISFRISCVFPEDIIPFRLSNKLSKYKKPTKYGIRRFISSIVYKGIEPVRCISVTNPTHLYITDDYIVTHNTYTAELVAKLLKRISLVINCSQYTSPTEILGGQTIEGYKEGKLIKAWKDGYLLILDEMPKLDPNTAGLFNDALAKSSKTRPDDMARISSTNPEEPPVERNINFCCIATGNIYPNSPDTRRYVGNNQQDLSLLDRFSGSVYFVEFSQYIDETSCRYQFLYDMLVGNYYEYMSAKRQGNTLPTARGLRTTMEHLDMKNYALVSYRTLTAFRIAFEYELVRAIAESEGKVVSKKGKTVSQTFENYLVAFPKDAKTTLINTTKFTKSFIDNQVADAIKTVIDNKDKVSGFIKILTKAVKDVAGDAFAQSKNWIIAEQYLKP
jgi:hypothetical protein